MRMLGGIPSTEDVKETIFLPIQGYRCRNYRLKMDGGEENSNEDSRELHNGDMVIFDFFYNLEETLVSRQEMVVEVVVEYNPRIGLLLIGERKCGQCLGLSLRPG
jgi:hypothetical protein